MDIAETKKTYISDNGPFDNDSYHITELSYHMISMSIITE